MLIFRQTSEIVSPLARSRSISRSSRATSSAVRRFFMGPSLAHSTEGLPFQVDQFLGGRPTASHFCLSVTFHDCRFHGRRDNGEPEWPPSPLRLFQSLVAAA